jgi:hypothetical protein
MSRISTGLAEAGRRFATEDGRLLRFAEGARPAISLHTLRLITLHERERAQPIYPRMCSSLCSSSTIIAIPACVRAVIATGRATGRAAQRVRLRESGRAYFMPTTVVNPRAGSRARLVIC